MFTSLRHFVGVYAARIHFRKSRERVVSFTESISNARQVLLLIPFGDPHQEGIKVIVDALKKNVRDNQITVVSSHHATLAIRELPHCEFIHILPTEINGILVPRLEVLQRIRKKQYDVAIDLGLDFVLPSGYIVKESRARVRIGFVRNHAEKFYNLLIQAGAGNSSKSHYEQMAACLQMF